MQDLGEKIQIIETTFYYEFNKKEIKSLKNLNSLFPAKALKLEPKITGKKLGKNWNASMVCAYSLLNIYNGNMYRNNELVFTLRHYLKLNGK